MWFLVWTFIVILMKWFDISSARYLFVRMEERINATGIFKQDWCTEENAFKNIIGVTLYVCGEECMRRRRCGSILYHSEMKFCRLRTAADITPVSTQSLHKTCVSSDISDWDFSVIGNCAPRPCDEKYRCYLNIYLIDRCELTECHDVTVSSHSHLTTVSSDVGAKNAYMCDRRYTRVGRSYVLMCNSNGMWSATDFACYPRCDFRPTFHGANVMPTSPHVYVVNETMKYYCKTGFQQQDSTNNDGIVCSENGEWSEPGCFAV